MLCFLFSVNIFCFARENNLIIVHHMPTDISTTPHLRKGGGCPLTWSPFLSVLTCTVGVKSLPAVLNIYFFDVHRQ